MADIVRPLNEIRFVSSLREVNETYRALVLQSTRCH